MKILLYSDHQKMIEKSGVGRALYHQRKALEDSHVEWTTNEKDDYDIVHINTLFPHSYLMSKKAKRHGKKVVYHAHSTEEDFKNSFIGSNLIAPLFKKWIMICYNTGDLIITPTNYSRTLLEGYGLTKPIVNISNGIDLTAYVRREEQRREFREKYGIKENEKVIISAGLYIERKGILDFVELAKRMPEYKFMWFGYTNLNSVPAKIRKAVKTRLPNLIFPGYVNRDELIKVYGGADLFLFLTNEETEGIVLLEALAMKIPTLIRDIPVFSDWVEDGKQVYKGSNITEFQNKITGILEGQLPDLTEEGYEIAKSRSIDEVGKKLVHEYEKLYLTPDVVNAKEAENGFQRMG